MNDWAFKGMIKRSRGGIIKWGTNVYRGMAGSHKAVDRYWREHWFVIAFRAREKSGLGRV